MRDVDRDIIQQISARAPDSGASNECRFLASFFFSPSSFKQSGSFQIAQYHLFIIHNSCTILHRKHALIMSSQDGFCLSFIITLFAFFEFLSHECFLEAKNCLLSRLYGHRAHVCFGFLGCYSTVAPIPRQMQAV